MWSKDLVKGLCAQTDNPWLEAHGNKPITETWLAQTLRGFGIRSQTLRMGKQSAKGYGYELVDFKEAFARFLKRGEE